MKHNTILVVPSILYEESFMQALKEYHAENRYLEFAQKDLKKDFNLFVEQLIDRQKGKNLKPGYVPETMYWLVEGNEFIGRVSIRHYLNEKLEEKGGHIGYDVRPSRRGMGYGKLLLKLGLKKAKDLGIDDAIITCDIENIPSRKIIEANGGVLEKKYRYNNKKKLKFHVKTSAILKG